MPITVDNTQGITVVEDEVEIILNNGGKRVAVFCGSASSVPLEYVDAARRVGRLLAERGCALVYGGGSWGLMGEVAKSAVENGIQTVIGVLPEFMTSTSGPCYGQVVVVPTMAKRKEVVNRFSDVFITLPGGFGTLDEMTEMLTWNQIGINNKFIGILNTAGFYNDWWRWCQRAVTDGLIRPEFMKNIIFADTPEQLVEEIMCRTPVEIPGKFLTRA
jgi:hypothetical protein